MGLTYITMDSVLEGVGASQVLPYVQQLPGRGHEIDLISFERLSVSSDEISDQPGLSWSPARFGAGSIALFRRIGIAAHAARSARGQIVHARSDLPALSVMLSGHDRWIWDMRAFWREQRIYLGSLREGSVVERLMRQVEKEAAKRSSAIICLAKAAVPIMAERFGRHITDKVTVIPTAVDTATFIPIARDAHPELRILLSGSYNKLYDGEMMARFIEALRARTRVQARWLGANPNSPWWHTLRPHLHDVVPPVPFAEVPEYVATSDVGLVVCQSDSGPVLRAAMPTKIAELLACGRAIVVNRGLGDMDDIINKYQCGVILQDESSDAIDNAADRLLDLITDPEFVERARACAEEVFDLADAVTTLCGLYDRLA